MLNKKPVILHSQSHRWVKQVLQLNLKPVVKPDSARTDKKPVFKHNDILLLTLCVIL